MSDVNGIFKKMALDVKKPVSNVNSKKTLSDVKNLVLDVNLFSHRKTCVRCEKPGVRCEFFFHIEKLVSDVKKLGSDVNIKKLVWDVKKLVSNVKKLGSDVNTKKLV